VENAGRLDGEGLWLALDVGEELQKSGKGGNDGYGGRVVGMQGKRSVMTHGSETGCGTVLARSGSGSEREERWSA
jgi:hypothetical protein